MAKLRKIDMSKIMQGPIQHESLPNALLDQIHKIHQTIGKYIGMNLEQFEVGFMRDLHPEREVAIWQNIADAWDEYHKQFTNGELLPDAQEKVLMGQLIQISSGVTESIDRQLLKCYHAKPQPPVVTRTRPEAINPVTIVGLSDRASDEPKRAISLGRLWLGQVDPTVKAGQHRIALTEKQRRKKTVKNLSVVIWNYVHANPQKEDFLGMIVLDENDFLPQIMNLAQQGVGSFVTHSLQSPKTQACEFCFVDDGHRDLGFAKIYSQGQGDIEIWFLKKTFLGGMTHLFPDLEF